MSKTDDYIDRATVVVAGLAMIVVGDDDDGRFLVVNLHSPHYRALFLKSGVLISTNMSKKSADRATLLLNRNLKYLKTGGES
jgi:hypothetical protein